MSGLIAIVGRPNVGKSALFNRIAGRRIAIVHDEPGVTRDRITAEAEWCGRPFTLVDTGGIGLLRKEKATDAIARAALEQVELAIDAADVIVVVVNVQEGVVPLDREVAERLRRTQKPVLVAVNKVDNFRAEAGADEFAALGFDKIFPVTAIHGQGIEALMNEAVKLLPAHSGFEVPISVSAEADAGGKPETSVQKLESSPLKLAIVGRPNVGKSSIINTLIGSQRVIVSPIPGTTRDAVDVPFEVETEGVRQKYILIDTAGVRRENRIDDSVEFYSVKRTDDSIERADMVVFVLDAESGILEQDKKVAAKITGNKKACILVVNKWDLFEEKIRASRVAEIGRRDSGETRRGPKLRTTLGEFGEWVQEKLFFLDYAPVIFTSAKSGFQLDRLLEAVRYVAAQLRQKIPTAILNRTLRDAIDRQQPVSSQGHFMKFFYASQVRQAPPTFVLFVNRDDLFSPTYERYLTESLRTAFGYEGCPIVLVAKPRPKTIDPVRKERPQQRPKFDAARRGRTTDRFRSRHKSKR
jgi:GTP-binding protein